MGSKEGYRHEVVEEFLRSGHSSHGGMDDYDGYSVTWDSLGGSGGEARKGEREKEAEEEVQENREIVEDRIAKVNATAALILKEAEEVKPSRSFDDPFSKIICRWNLYNLDHLEQDIHSREPLFYRLTYDEEDGGELKLGRSRNYKQSTKMLTISRWRLGP